MEKISNYNTDGTMLRKQQERMFEMLCVIDDICVKNEINYWLSGGTLLGAVRHGGFIPWDDDLDIQLMKDDYNKLLGLLKTELPEQYQLQTSKTDRNYFARYAKVRDVNSLLEDSDYTLGYKYKGIFIDIFLLKKQINF
ncbi:phosphorylcholine transferase LicD [Bacteroides fragilis]